MTPRERVATALRHEEPDRVPLDIGSGTSNSLLIETYENLKAHLGITVPTRVMAKITRVAYLDEATMVRLGSDMRPVRIKGPKNWTPPPSDPDTLISEYGCRYRRARYPGGHYWELVHSPLAHATLSDLDAHTWPDPDDPGRFEGLAEEVQDLYINSAYALVGCSGFQTFWQPYFALRGLEQALVDLVRNKEFVFAVLDRVYEISAAITRRFLEITGPYLTVVRTADDLATQNSLLMSPATYRELIQPYHQRFNALIRQYTDAKVFFHCCGNVTPLMDDLIAAGFEAIHPVQVSAIPDPADLKARYGDKITFWGGIDTQHVLPKGTPGEVREEVQLRLRQLAPGGGYIAGAVHNIQPDVASENILAMSRAVRELGRYPMARET
jgi:uroporphyrinogen decarboxylase